jgi:LysM repeat protein
MLLLLLCQPLAGGAQEGSTIRVHQSIRSVFGTRFAAVGLLALVAASGIAGSGTHTVKAGETASQIAADHGVTVAELAAANGLRDPDVVVVGTTLVIPGRGTASSAAPAGGGSYTVKAGDTLSSIASATGTTATALAQANGIADPHMIVVGRILRLVGAGTTAATPAAASASAFAANGLPQKLVNRPARLALRPTFERWASRYGVPADLLEALAWMESGWQNDVVSSTGAVGIGQLMPDTVDFLRLLIGDRSLDPTVPEDNIQMTARFLGYLLTETHGDAATSVAAYYQGLRSIRTRPQYDDTRTYVAVVLALRPHFA